MNASSIRDKWCYGKSITQNKGTSAVLSQSGLDKNGGLIPWHAIAIFEMFKTSWQTGKPMVKGDSEKHVKAQSFCEDDTSKDPFSQCENLQNLQGIHIQVKSEYVGTIDNK